MVVTKYFDLVISLYRSVQNVLVFQVSQLHLIFLHERHNRKTGPGSSVGTGGHGFDPGPQHTEVVKNGTSCS